MIKAIERAAAVGLDADFGRVVAHQQEDGREDDEREDADDQAEDRKSTRLNSSHLP